MKDRFGEEEEFEGVEGVLAGGSPVPWEVCLGEVDEDILWWALEFHSWNLMNSTCPRLL